MAEYDLGGVGGQNQGAGFQAQLNAHLQLMARITVALENAGTGLLYTPYVWTGAGNLVVATQWPNATTGTIIIAQASAAALDVTLPATGGPWCVVDGAGVAAADNITIKAAGGRTIRGGSSLVLNTNWGAFTLLLNGSNYITVGKC